MEHWTITAGHVPAPWASILIVLCMALAFGEAVLAFRRRPAMLTRGRAAALLVLRTLGLLALLAIALELTLRVDRVTPLGSRIVLLLDRSASMGVPDGEPAKPRYRRLLEQWNASADLRSEWNRQGLSLEVRTFERSSAPLAGHAGDVLAVAPAGTASDLAQALLELQDTAPTRQAPLRAVMVLSDGLVTSDVAAEGRLEEAAEALGVPISTMSLGSSPLRDISVARVRAGEFAFVENVTEIDATIVAYGFEARSVEVELRRDGELLERRPLVLERDGKPSVVRFEVAPDRVGQFVYEVVVDPQEGEATEMNNRRAFVVKVLRDKVRVLHVAGRPDWDVRALRTLLRRDPNVELLSYYILRGLDDIAREDTSAPLSLIPFPTDELFEEELGSFDLVILHNFDAVQHQVGQYVENMAQYVEEGGALVLIGGDLAFSDQGYGAARMTRIMPVDTRPQLQAEHDPFRPTLTDAGRRHPITAWLALAADGWSDLPELDTFNPLRMASHGNAIGAAALLVHPTARDGQGQARPLLAVAEPGKGRVMVLGSAATWRMGFAPDLPLIDGARPYDLLWLGAIRWLLRDDSSGRLQLETNRPRFEEGDPVELQATTLSPSYAPEAGVEIPWEVRKLGGSGSDSPPLHRGQWTSDPQGRAHETLRDLPAGAYAATARRSTDAESQTQVRRVFVVETPGRELSYLAPEPGREKLRRLAEATGGLFIDGAHEPWPTALPLAAPTDDQPLERVDGRSEQPLWNHWWVLLILTASFGSEWILRRRSASA